MTDEQEVRGDIPEGEPEKEWPAVSVAYDFVLPSYQLLVSRFEAADTRITALLTLTSTLTIAVPIFARNVRPGISFASPFFVFGIAIFMLGGLFGIIGRVAGSLTLPDPAIIYNQNLQASEWEFKKNQIYYAGENFNANVEAVRWKGNVAISLAIALLVEVSAFVAWLAT